MFFSTTSSSVRKSNTRSDDITRTTGLEGLAVDPWTGGECHGDKDLVRTGLDASGPVKREGRAARLILTGFRFSSPVLQLFFATGFFTPPPLQQRACALRITYRQSQV